ncbi:MAG: hypothetical protein AAF624_12320, partial [Bacteroidota bacterium]
MAPFATLRPDCPSSRVRPFGPARRVAQQRLGWLRRAAAAGTLTLAMLHGTPEATAQTPTFVGGEFQVNTFTTARQESAAVAMDADGDFVVVWQSINYNGADQDGDGAGIYAQRYDASGSAVGSEFQVNTFTTGDQANPSVAMDADGDFVVVWQSYGQDGSYDGVYARRYNADGTAPTTNGAEFRVNSFTTGTQAEPSVTMDASGAFVVVWESDNFSGVGQDGSLGGVYAQRYDASGNPAGGEFRVNATTENDQGQAVVAMDADGDFVVAWSSYNQDGSYGGVYVRRFNADGSAPSVNGSEFAVNTFTTGNQGFPSVAMDADGDFVIAWQSAGQDEPSYPSYGGVYAQRYDASGVAQGAEFLVNTFTTDTQGFPTVAMDTEGDFVVAWASYGQDASGTYGIFAQRYTSTGGLVGAEFQVNTFTTDTQNSPSVAIDAVGDFVVAWESSNQDGSDRGIYAQRFDAAAASSGSEFLVNTFTTGGQGSPAVASDADGDVVVVWTSDGQEGSGANLYAQRYDAGGNTVGAEFRVNSFTTSDPGSAAVAMDANGDFVVVWDAESETGEDAGGVFAQRFNADGSTPTVNGAQFRVNTFTTGNQEGPSVAMDDAGNFVVAWSSYGQDGEYGGIYAQRYDASGNTVGGEFLVNTTTTNGQLGPAVAMDADGDFVVAWESYGQDDPDVTYYSGVYARRYNSAGTAQGGEFLVNTFTANNQIDPAVGMDADGDFVIAWESLGQDDPSVAYNSGIYARRYNNAGAAQGAEFLVNTFTTNSQSSPAVGMDADGDFVVVWQSFAQDGDYYGVFAQRYASAGAAVGPEFQVNTETSASQDEPSVAMDDSGDFVVAWQSEGQDGSGRGVYAQRYDAVAPSTLSEVPSGDEFQVNTETSSDQREPAVASNADGDFVVAWQSRGQDDPSASTYEGIYAQRYSALGVPQGAEFRVNTFTSSRQLSPSVAMDADGDFVVVWSSNFQDDPGSPLSGVYAQRYDGAGVAQGSEFRVNTTTTNSQRDPAVAMDADGDFVVAWASFAQDGSDYGVYAQRYDASGNAVGSEFLVNTTTASSQTLPSVAMDADGDFVVTWESYGQDGSYGGIYARRYNADGTTPSVNGDEFRVNTFTTGNQNGSSVAMDASGAFVIVWQSRGQDDPSAPFDGGIYAQRYTAAGTPQGPEFLVNTTTTDGQRNASAAMDADGDFVVTWESEDQDGSDYGVYAQRFDALGTPQGTEFRLNIVTTDDQERPVVALDDAGDFVIAWQSDSQDGSADGVFAQRYALTQPTTGTGTIALDLQGAPGWRMLAQPSGTTLTTLLDPLWTQGVPGADAATTNPAVANVLIYDETDATPNEDVGFVAPATLEGATPGQGVIVFVFADDNFDGTPDPFPKLLSAPYTAPAGTIVPPLTFTDSGTPAADGWHLLGNPFAEPLSWDAALANVDVQSVDATVYVWDPKQNAYRTWNGTSGDLLGGEISGLQGFFVKATAASPAPAFLFSAADTGTLDGRTYSFYSRTGTPVKLALTLETAVGEARAFVEAGFGGEMGPDRKDGYLLAPLAGTYA